MGKSAASQAKSALPYLITAFVLKLESISRIDATGAQPSPCSISGRMEAHLP